MALIYPFHWPYVYVPVLPFTLLTFLEAPTPFILGINSEYLDTSDDDDEENLSEVYGQGKLTSLDCYRRFR